MRLRKLFAYSSGWLLALLISIPAQATFPGKNGRIAFLIPPDLYSMNPDGSDVKQLTNLGPDAAAADFESWSPEGKLIVFEEYRPPDYLGQLWLMNADGSNQHLVFKEQSASEDRPSFSPDGKWILFSRCPIDLADTCVVYRVSLQGTGLTEISTQQTGIADVSAVYSSDGNSIALATLSRDGILSRIALMDANGSKLRTLTPAAISATRPTWSPDGSRMAFHTHCCNPQNQEIWLVKPDGSDLHALTHNGHDYAAGFHDSNPSWSPDGQEIVFQRFLPDFSEVGIWIIDVNGHEAKILSLGKPAMSRAHSLEMNGRLMNGKLPATRVRQVESGGGLPRWGSAQN
jgi:Tol biopolymer transport system component